MATDEVLTRLCQEENRVPTLRLYTWSPWAASIGYFQKMNSTLDVDKCKKSGLDIVRRPTGGRAVLHQDEITYSICASNQNFPQLGNSVDQTYRQISFAFLEVLKALGIKAQWTKSARSQRKEEILKPCFVSSSKYEVTIDNRKLIGSAQRRFGNVLLQHGSIPLRRNMTSLALFLPQEEDKNRIIEEQLQKQSTDLEELLGRETKMDEITEAIGFGFRKHFKIGFVQEELSFEELLTIERLRKGKYSKNWWNLLR